MRVADELPETRRHPDPLAVDPTDSDPGGQINVPPRRHGALWMVIAPAVRCPECGSTNSKACTGKRVNSEGFLEHYRVCRDCQLRFRLILE